MSNLNLRKFMINYKTTNTNEEGLESLVEDYLVNENGKSFDPEDRLNYKFPDMENYLKWWEY
jgi:hypothetical protein